jgi:hypothetical protein
MRGLGRLLVALVLLAGGAMALDFFFAFSPEVRIALFALWALLALVGMVRGVVAPLFQRFAFVDLAAAVESQHPELGERLLSTVELTQTERLASPELARLLLEETAARTSDLDFAAVAPSRTARTWLTLGVVTVLLLLTPVLVVPSASMRLATRFFAPWVVPAFQADFAFHVEPGDGVVARGRAVPIRVTLQPRDETVRLPEKVALVFTPAEAAPLRRDLLPLEASPATFGTVWTLGSDGEYHIEAGNARSETFTLRSVTPVELVPDSPDITLTPPEYARATVDPVSVGGLIDLIALRGSSIQFTFRFTRPAVRAVLRWTPDEGEPRAVPLVADPDQQTMTASLLATHSGQYRLELEAEHGIRTPASEDMPYGGRIVVREDQPPSLTSIKGAWTGRTIPVHERLPLEARLADDVAVAEAALEYRIDDAAEESAKREALPLVGAGQRESTIKHMFMLASKVSPGQTLHYRLRYQDNRPAEFGGPNVKYHPEKGWLQLKIVAQGASPREEDITAQRDALNKKIEAIKAELRSEMRGSDRLRAESRDEEQLTPDQRERAKSLQEQNRKIQQQLEGLAREADAQEELQPLAEAARELAATEMRQAGRDLDQAADPRTGPMPREQAFRGVEKELSAAYDKLESLQKKNEQLAKDRMDQSKVEALAERQKALAEEAEKWAAQENDPEAKAELEKVRREQDKLAQELENLTRDSDLLQKTLEAARTEQTRREAEKAAELAKEQRELAAAIDNANRAATKEKLQELARKQEELAARAEKLAQQTEKALKADRGQAMPTQAPQAAAESLAKGDGEKAAQEQDRAARDLDKLARDLNRLANLASDPREAARQLARMQEELGNKARAEKNLSPEKAAELASEQQAIREAVEELSLPPARKDLAAMRQKTREALAEAEKQLMARDKNAAAQMDRAKEDLRKLAGQIPSLAERQEQARRDLDRLARDQDELARRTDADKKGPVLAKQQAQLAEKLAELDAPGQETRRDRALEQMAQAAEDLQAQKPDDARVAQQRAKQQLDRLREALNGQKPADEKAAELAQRQRELAERAEQAAQDKGTPRAKLDEMRQQQNKLSWETEALAAPDAPASKKEAAKAVREASSKANAQEPTTPETREAMKDAARKLEDLARALSGQENEAARAERLAKQQAQAAADAKDRPGTPQDQQRARDLAKELDNLRAGEAGAEKAKAREALEKAAKAEPKDRAEADAQARDALKELAQKWAQAEKPKSEPKQAAEGKRSPLPNQDQADAARELAKEQRDLRDAVRRAMDNNKAETPMPNDKAGKLAAEQEAISRESAKLAEKVAGEQGEKSRAGQKAQAAAQAGEQASKELTRGALDKAAVAGKTSEHTLKELAKALQDTPRGNDTPKVPEADTLETARKLAQRQEAVNRELGKVAQDSGATRGQQMARQSELEKEAGELAKRLQELGEQPGQVGKAPEQTRQAAEAARQAREAMRQAGELGKSGNESAARQARERAAQALERAAGRAEQAGNNPAPNAGRPGQALTEAQGQMNDARQQLGKGQPGPASQAMGQAGDTLRQAAEQLAQFLRPGTKPNPEGQPGPGGAPEGGIVDGTTQPKLPAGFDPKKWGELPGELRTKIVQDARAKFGDDYARMIKLYFEQLADSPQKR